MNDLPPLPEPTLMMPEFVDGIGEHEEPMFDTAALQDYARAALAQYGIKEKNDD